MASRSATLKELQSLRDELGTEPRGRQPKAAQSPPAPEPPADVVQPAPAGAATPPDGPAGPPGDDIGALMREAADYFEERAGDIAAHPLAMAVGGLVVGLIIGRMLPRR